MVDGGRARPRHLLGGQAERERSRGGAAVRLGDVQTPSAPAGQQLELLVRVLPVSSTWAASGAMRSRAISPREVADGPLSSVR